MTIAKEMLKLTSSILLINPKLHPILLELGCYGKLYSVLSAVRVEFQNEDILEISNTLFNLSTKGHYHFLVEKSVFSDQSQKLEAQIEKLNQEEHLPIWKYIPLKEHFFLSLLLKSLFEWNVNPKIKTFYLQILEGMLERSLSNAGICTQVIIRKFQKFNCNYH